MAVAYVRSTDGSDADTGGTWALAEATLAGAFAQPAAAGDRLFLSDVHAETQASNMTLTSPGTAAAPLEILCGDDVAEPPTALADTATITTTGASSISLVGHAYVYGVTFNAGTGASASNFQSTATTSWWWKLEECVIKLLSTNAASRIYIGGTAAGVDSGWEFFRTDVQFSAVGQCITLGSRFRWTGGTLLLGTAPTGGLIKTMADVCSDAKIIGVDLSAIGSNALVGVGVGSMGGSIDFIDCKIAAGTTLVTGTNPGPGQTIVRMINCDSGDTNYRTQTHQYEGDVYSETVVVRTGGASDGTTPFSRKMVSSAGACFVHPLPGLDIEVRNETVGSAITATVHILHDSLTALTDAEVWLEIFYLGTSGVPLGLIASDRKASIIATAADQTVSTATWTTTGITNVNKQQLAVAFTPQEAGTYIARVMLAKPSYTVYYGPLVTES